MGYARLYDGTVAADYYRSMDQIERRLTLGTDALSAGTLNESQRQTVQALRAGILALAEQGAKAPNSAEEGTLSPTRL